MLPGKVYTPEAVLEAVWRHKWLVVLPFVMVAAGVAWYSSRLPNLYRSETLIMVVPQRVPDTYVRSTVSARIEDRLRSISEQILSRSRLEQVILEFDLYVPHRSRLPMEDVVQIMRREIVVEPVRGDMFRIAFVAQDPAGARARGHQAGRHVHRGEPAGSDRDCRRHEPLPGIAACRGQDVGSWATSASWKITACGTPASFPRSSSRTSR